MRQQYRDDWMSVATFTAGSVLLGLCGYVAWTLHHTRPLPWPLVFSAVVVAGYCLLVGALLTVAGAIGIIRGNRP